MIDKLPFFFSLPALAINYFYFNPSMTKGSEQGTRSEWVMFTLLLNGLACGIFRAKEEEIAKKEKRQPISRTLSLLFAAVVCLTRSFLCRQRTRELSSFLKDKTCTIYCFDLPINLFNLFLLSYQLAELVQTTLLRKAHLFDLLSGFVQGFHLWLIWVNPSIVFYRSYVDPFKGLSEKGMEKLATLAPSLALTLHTKYPKQKQAIEGFVQSLYDYSSGFLNKSVWSYQKSFLPSFFTRYEVRLPTPSFLLLDAVLYVPKRLSLTKFYLKIG